MALRKDKSLIKNTKGFTLSELITGLVVGSFLLVAIFSFFNIVVLDGFQLQENLLKTTERIDAASYLIRNIGDASSFIIQPSISDVNAPYSPTWPVIHPGDNVHYANPVGVVEPIFYFTRYAYKTDGTIALKANGSPYEDEFILYHDEAAGKLYVRTLANTLVANNKRTTSCPPTAATASCPPDYLILTDVTETSFAFFAKDGAQINYYESPDPTNPYMPGSDFPLVEVLDFKITTVTNPGVDNGETEAVTPMRIALRNG